jgi:hypothetical protein
MSATQTTELTEQEPNKRKKRALLLLVGIVAASGVGTLAYGYWTESGAGTGSGSVATTSALKINQTSTVSGLFPDSTPQDLSGDFDNSNTSPVTLSAVTASVTDVRKAGASILGTCGIGNFDIAGTGVVGGSGVVPAGNGVGSWDGLTIQLIDTGANQDACKGASPVITYAAS